MRTGGDAPAEGKLPCRSGGVRARKRRCRLRRPSPLGPGLTSPVGVRSAGRGELPHQSSGVRTRKWRRRATASSRLGALARDPSELGSQGAEPWRPSSAHPLAHLRITPATKPLVSSAHAGPKVGLVLHLCIFSRRKLASPSMDGVKGDGRYLASPNKTI
ncbi:unnamed protein product [Urochloa humidicola]